MTLNTVITGTGAAPVEFMQNSAFLDHDFYDVKTGKPSEKSNKDIVDHLAERTGFNSRSRAPEGAVLSDMATDAVTDFFDRSSWAPNNVDYLIVAHNSGDRLFGSDLQKYGHPDIVPAHASRLKARWRKNDDSFESPLLQAFDLVGDISGVETMLKGRGEKVRIFNSLEVFYCDRTIPLTSLIVHHNNLHIGISPSMAERAATKARNTGYGFSDDLQTFDVIYGCPGWVKAMDLADGLLKEKGKGARAIVVGAEHLSYYSDPHDKNSLIFADGAAAVGLECIEDDESYGIIGYAHHNLADDHSLSLLKMEGSNNPDYSGPGPLLKMNGWEVLRYVKRSVPIVIADAIKSAGQTLGKPITVNDIDCFFGHGAGKKLLENVEKSLRGLGAQDPNIPCIIEKYGNSSVATIPLLLDHVYQGKVSGCSVRKGDLGMFVSMGASMNSNALVYRAHKDDN